MIPSKALVKNIRHIREREEDACSLLDDIIIIISIIIIIIIISTIKSLEQYPVCNYVTDKYSNIFRKLI